MTLSCYLYQLSFVTPLQTSAKTFSHRQGFILCASTDNKNFYGEAAPLPGYSPESTKKVKKLLQNHSDYIPQLLQHKNAVEKLDRFYQEESIPASLQFGLDTLAYQLEANQDNTTLLSHLFENVSQKVAVNGLLSLNSDNTFEQIENLVEKGYKTIKCKIGIDFDSEYRLLTKIRNRYPKVTIRVDANQAWTLDKALKNCTKLASLDIQYCEEPLQESTPANIEQLFNQQAIPIALDESIIQHSYWPNLLPFTQFLILKPMLTGSFKKNIETKRLADTHNNKVVVTTSLESNVGLYFTTIMAAGLGSNQLAHGLSTQNLYTENFCSDVPSIHRGYINLSTQQLPKIDFTQSNIFTRIY